ncbi:molybdenum cofactor biosynthesis protein MoaE [Acetobacter thailandicus]|nr:molybdenum cofactor biosynthesis protein MoaE [Acetobacter thailandicus]MBS0980012.1 molybdenum cofactor biosynthesis protein MoaE [Acetobacter thailandicus]
MMQHVVVQEAAFDVGHEYTRLAELSDHVGGVSIFVGCVRDTAGDLQSLTLEHYPGMTEKMLQNLSAEAFERFHLAGCTIIHRVGALCVGSPIVFVGAAAAHRAEALHATAFLIDKLKTGAPFWKCEQFKDGRRVWVEAKAADDEAAAFWS